MYWRRTFKNLHCFSWSNHFGRQRCHLRIENKLDCCCLSMLFTEIDKLRVTYFWYSEYNVWKFWSMATRSGNYFSFSLRVPIYFSRSFLRLLPLFYSIFLNLFGDCLSAYFSSHMHSLISSEHMFVGLTICNVFTDTEPPVLSPIWDD